METGDRILIERASNGVIVRRACGQNEVVTDDDTLVFNNIERLCSRLKIHFVIAGDKK